MKALKKIKSRLQSFKNRTTTRMFNKLRKSPRATKVILTQMKLKLLLKKRENKRMKMQCKDIRFKLVIPAV
jgi:hypothetical protein